MESNIQTRDISTCMRSINNFQCLSSGTALIAWAFSLRAVLYQIPNICNCLRTRIQQFDALYCVREAAGERIYITKFIKFLVIGLNYCVFCDKWQSAMHFNPTRGDHGPVRPRKNKTVRLFIFLKMCGAASMTFHEICKDTILDEKICNYKLNVSIFIKNIQKKIISIVEGAYVWQSVFQMYSGVF